MIKTGLRNSNYIEINKISKALLLFSIVSASLLFTAGFYYKDLGCDGGWYSYPAFAISRSGNAGENLESIENIKSIEGIKAIFGFKTYYSIRIFYTALWFKYVSKSIFFLKVLSLLELVPLVVLMYFLISKFCQDKVIALMLLALFINDKTILLNAASDYRPDNMVAALSCLTFLIMLKQNSVSALIAAIFAGVLMMLTHITAPIPLFCIICFFVLRNILSGNHEVKDNYKYVLVGMIALFVFLNRGQIFDALFLSNGESLPSGVNAWERILNVWEKGPTFISSKEFYRWKTYFFSSNVAQLLVLIMGCILFFKKWPPTLQNENTGLALILSIFMGFILFAALDPHKADMHVIPIIPFFFLFLSHGISSNTLNRKALTYILVGLVCFASFASIALAWKISFEGKNFGYNIVKVRDSFEELIKNNDREYLIVGPTEIWPFIEEDKNVLIVDKTRSGKDFQILEPVIDSVDYIIINNDYRGCKWMETFLGYFRNLSLKEVFSIGGEDEFINVFKLEKKS